MWSEGQSCGAATGCWDAILMCLCGFLSASKNASSVKGILSAESIFADILFTCMYFSRRGKDIEVILMIKFDFTTQQFISLRRQRHKPQVKRKVSKNSNVKIFKAESFKTRMIQIPRLRWPLSWNPLLKSPEYSKMQGIRQKRRNCLTYPALSFTNARVEHNQLFYCAAMKLFFIALSWNQTLQLNNA